MGPRPTIVIADDLPIVAEALAASLERHYDIVSVITELNAVAPAVRQVQPSIVLLDLAFKGHSSLHVLPAILEASPPTRIVVFTAYAEPVFADAAIEAGAHGYVLKSSSSTELLLAMSEALTGRVFVSDFTGGMSAEQAIAALRIRITRKEERILSALQSGRNRAEAGGDVGISAKGVDYHNDRIRATLGFTRTEQLVRWFGRCATLVRLNR